MKGEGNYRDKKGKKVLRKPLRLTWVTEGKGKEKISFIRGTTQGEGLHQEKAGEGDCKNQKGKRGKIFGKDAFH